MPDRIVEVTALAAGGDGVARDEGRVTFVPRTAPGDRVRVRLTKETKSFARGELVEIVTASPDRVVPPCPHFIAGCGGCAWQHIARPAQLAAKQQLVANALRKLDVAIEPIADPCSPYGWRRRARFHVAGGKLGLYREGTHDLVPIEHCPQLEPALDAAMRAISTPPDGELVMLVGAGIVIGTEKPWKGAAALVGKAGIVGVVAGETSYGKTRIAVEPGLVGGPWDFAQASTAGNAALIELARRAVGPASGPMLELHAGAGNLTRGFRADGWTVTTADIVPGSDIVGSADQVLARAEGPFDAIVLDPPRTGALEAVPGILRHAPAVVVYVSCDPATLARDAEKLVAGGYRAERAWPVDLMPQTAHVEVVLRLTRTAAGT
jgi:23S rRNA (uracil1939-C5)-methyltransferase